ncbi:translesion error-prone DNA polymerase V autoproteolytic subunit [Stenotrophomonas pigmentata]|uniref:translesion error-prone DNA polymerase V autoproteolytic subunit n=1 Tax=Stenotrophomonas pigmentata TaxID=3055080 RepID=UPI0026F2DC55|nr:translesion error-prone DNA polymerase V autoproteolytic subunit [Stenotrophomonas sp. 610A2]
MNDHAHLHSASYSADPAVAASLALAAALPDPPGLLSAASALPQAMLRPLLNTRAELGFPSPAEDHMGEDLDLTARCIRNPLATYFVEASGNSMRDFGIHSGDILVVDRSINAKHLDIVMVLWDGGYTVKQLCIRGRQVELRTGNPDHASIIVPPEDELLVWGVITWSITRHYRR